jgi:uncharacterized RDD family membrane protein YckC
VNPPAAPGEHAGLARRFLSLIYETLLLSAVALAGMVPFVLATQSLDPPFRRALAQIYLVVLIGAYFIWHWTRSGQTLAMKTWRIRLVTREGGRLDVARALVRYALTFVSVAPAGAGFLWALIDRDRQFLHDRLAGTRIIAVPATRSSLPQR